MKKVVISASASLQDEIINWVNLWEYKGYKVIDYPKKLNDINDYKKVYKEFYKSLDKTDILFVINSKKNDIEGYIGSGVFAEINYVVVNNLLGKSNSKIYLLNKLNTKLPNYFELKKWLEYGWLEIHKDKNAE